MPIAFFKDNPRTAITIAVLLAVYIFAFIGEMRAATHASLMPFFEWMEVTWFGWVGKNYGGIFAVVQAFHLLSMAVIGGCVLASDGRLLGAVLTDVPARAVVDRAYEVFKWGLIVVLVTGVFMACGVAMKIYYLQTFWYKMLALATGIAFTYLIRKPLLADDIDSLDPWVVKGTAIASILVWFTVAATGRWIGFDG